MPTFTLASPEEAASLAKTARAGAADLTAFASALTALGERPNADEPGYSVWAKMTADGTGDNRRTMMRRTSQAAKAAKVHVQILKHKADDKVFWLRLRPAPVPRKRSTNGTVTTVAAAPPAPPAAPAPAPAVEPNGTATPPAATSRQRAAAGA